MQKIIVISVGIVVSLIIVVVVMVIFKRKERKPRLTPLMKEFKDYQEDMSFGKFETSFDREPSNLLKTEKVLYQTVAEFSDVNFDLKKPESTPEPCTIWITDKKLLIERRGEEERMYSFRVNQLEEFEYDLIKRGHTFIFGNKGKYYKFELKDLYALALIEFKVKGRDKE